jgi:site-specific DNA-methyltransferase (adenine-specific)
MKKYLYFKMPGVKIYNCPIEEIVDQLPKTDLILADPPYGIGDSWKQKWNDKNSRGNSRLWGEVPKWDETTIDLDLLLKIISLGDKAIVWGGNFYDLPKAPCWFIWDKLQKFAGSDFEMAWTNLRMPPRAFRMSRIDAYKNFRHFKKQHGAEKPVQLYEFCIKKAKAESIIDPFMGTGNSLVAAKRQRIPAIGVDINPEYCKEAKRRLLKCRIGFGF